MRVVTVIVFKILFMVDYSVNTTQLKDLLVVLSISISSIHKHSTKSSIFTGVFLLPKDLLSKI